MRARQAVLVIGFSLLPFAGAAATADRAHSEAGQTILSMAGYWRAYVMRGPNVVPLDLLKEMKPGAVEAKVFQAAQSAGSVRTSPQPSDWIRTDYDDSFWARSRGPFGCRKGWAGRYVSDYWAILCLRGKFHVEDPAAVRKLTLTCTYIGGVAVYLNGREVLRRHLPQGALTPDTLAASYPREAYVDGTGKIIPMPYHLSRRIEAGDADLAERVAKRAPRVLSTVDLPLGDLRKGVNVLAVELRRSAFRPEALRWGYRKYQEWPHIGLTSLRLAAESAAGAIQPNLSRPKGFQVWNEDIHRLFAADAYGDPNEALRPIRLVGARNGHYSGQVVVGSTLGVLGLKADVTDLRGAGSSGTIPASNVRVRYGTPYDRKETWKGRRGRSWGGPRLAFASLEATAPAKVPAVQPVWVTVGIPKDTPAGIYRGTLTIHVAPSPFQGEGGGEGRVSDVREGVPLTLTLSPQGRGKRDTRAIAVPMEVEVVDWTLPPRASDYRVYIGIYQSPESLAVYYDAPMWSEKHWRLLERAWRLQGYLGNNFLQIPLVTRTQYGNDESMIPWVEQADGSYGYDFAAYDRFAAMALKYCRIKMISYQVYLCGGVGGGGGWAVRPPEKPTFVTVVDPKTGTREPMQLPAYDTEESRRLWKPFVAAIRERNRTLGVEKDTTIVLGMSADCGVHKAVRAHFKEVWPEAGWHYGAHGRGGGAAGGKGFEFMEYMYAPAQIGPPGTGRDGKTPARFHWWTPHPKGAVIVFSQRIGGSQQPPLSIRTLAERTMLVGDNGAGRMCLDYWPVQGSPGGSHGGSLFCRWPSSTVGQRTPQLRMLSLPGKDGPVTTVKIETMREGNQEAEARAFVELAVVNNKVGGDLAARGRRLLDQRWQLCRITHNRYSLGPAERFAYNAGWQQRSADLYRLAAEVAGRLAE